MFIDNINQDSKIVPSITVIDPTEPVISDSARTTQVVMQPGLQATMQNEEFLKTLYDFINYGSPEKIKIALATLSLKGFDLNLPHNEGKFILEKLIHESELNYIFKPIIQALLEWGANPHLHNSHKKLSAIASIAASPFADKWFC